MTFRVIYCAYRMVEMNYYLWGNAVRAPDSIGSHLRTTLPCWMVAKHTSHFRECQSAMMPENRIRADPVTTVRSIPHMLNKGRSFR
jgi:hypothetical protein